MADLRRTPGRVALMRAIDAGKVYTIPGTGRAFLINPDDTRPDREVSTRIDELADAGLIARPTDTLARRFEVTDAGRAWMEG